MGKHAILVIKNKDKYLQYYDENWKSYLFLNCRINDKDDIEIIKDNLLQKLNIERDVIQCDYIGVKKHSKYSESYKTIKEYEHFFYNVKLSDNVFEDLSAKLKNKKYKLFTYQELLNDERIMQVNSDIVGYIKEFNL